MPAETAPSLEHRATTVLTWLRVEQSGPLARAGYRPRRKKGEFPLPAISKILEDGVVLAEVLVALDALPHSSVLRAARRPASVPDAAAVERRYIEQQYKHNTRRVVHTLGKIFEHLRGEPLPAGALQAYMGGDVASIRPYDNVAPCIALAELVITAAMYGPRSEHFVWGIWHLPCRTSKEILQRTLNYISHFLQLLPFQEVVEKANIRPLVEMNREPMPDTSSPPLAHPGQSMLPPQPPQPPVGVPSDPVEGMGDRKISLISEDGHSPEKDGKRSSKLYPHQAHDLHVNPVQVSHSATHGLGPSSARGILHCENDSEYMTQRLAYNEANARLQEVARTRAIVSRLEGSVRGTRGMFTGQGHRPSGGPAQPPPTLHGGSYGPLPGLSSFLPSSQSNLHPPPAVPGTPKQGTSLSPRLSPVINLDHLGRQLERTPLQPFLPSPAELSKEIDAKENEFDSEAEEEEAAVAARNMHHGSALNEMPEPMPAISKQEIGEPDIRETVVVSESSVALNIAARETVKAQSTADYFSSAVTDAPLTPSGEQSGIERDTSSLGQGNIAVRETVKAQSDADYFSSAVSNAPLTPSGEQSGIERDTSSLGQGNIAVGETLQAQSDADYFSSAVTDAPLTPSGEQSGIERDTSSLGQGNIAVGETVKAQSDADYFSSAVSNAPLTPSGEQSGIERDTSVSGQGSSSVLEEDEAKKRSQFSQIQKAREEAKQRFARQQERFDDLTLSKCTTYDANEVVEQETVVTDDEEEVHEYVEGDEEPADDMSSVAKSFEELEEAEEEAAIAKRKAEMNVCGDSRQSQDSRDSSLCGTGIQNIAGNVPVAPTGLADKSRPDGPVLDLNQSASPIPLPLKASHSFTASQATGTGKSTTPFSSNTGTLGLGQAATSEHTESAHSKANTAVSSLPVQAAPIIAAPIIAAPVTSSWVPAASSPASGVPAQQSAAMQGVQISPSSLLPLPPLNLTPQRTSTEGHSRRSGRGSGSASPSARHFRTSPRDSGGSQYGGVPQQFVSPSQQGHPIGFPYGNFSPVGSPALPASGSGRQSPAPLYIPTNVAVAVPSASGYQSPSFILHTVPVQSVIVHQGVSAQPDNSQRSPAVQEAASNQGGNQFSLPPSAGDSAPREQVSVDTGNLRSPSPHTHGGGAFARASQTSTSGSSSSSSSSSNDEDNSSSSGEFVDARGSSGAHSPGGESVEKLIESASRKMKAASEEPGKSAASEASPKLRTDGTSVPYIPGKYAEGTASGGIPGTPPSPPMVSDVVASFAVKMQDRPREDIRPVSTMMPSPRLFQKLISVWQHSADEEAAASSTVSTKTKGPEVREGSTTTVEDKPSDDSGISTPLTTEVPMLNVSSSAPRGGRRLAMRVQNSPLQHLALSPTAQAAETSNQSDVPPSEPQTDRSVDGLQSEETVGGTRSDDHWRNAERTSETAEWDAALKRNTGGTTVGEPSSSEITTSTASVDRRVRSNARSPVIMTDTQPQRFSQESTQSMSPAPGEPEDRASASPSSGDGIQLDGDTVRVDPSRLDWLTQELLAARDAISQKDLARKLEEKDTTDEKEVLILEKQDAESVVAAMKHILAEREGELREARRRLSIAISGVSKKAPQSPRRQMPTPEEIEARIEAEASRKANELFIERARELHPQLPISPMADNSDILERFDRSDAFTAEVAKRSTDEMNRLWGEVQVSMEEKMMQMINRRDTELAELKIELTKRQKAVEELQEARLNLVDQNAFMKSEATSAKQERELIITQAAMEISQVQAQLVLVDKFSKKLHDTFKETEMLRAQVADSQAKMASFTSNAGISAREAKELREAVLRAQAEADRWRNVAESAKTEKKEAEHRAEEIDRLYKNAAPPVNNRYMERDDGAYSTERSFEQGSHSGRHRGGASGSRHRDTSAEQMRGRGIATQESANPASRAWNSIKAIVTGKDAKVGHRKPPKKPAPPRRAPQYEQQSDEAQSASAPYRSPQYSPRDFHGPTYPPRGPSDHSQSPAGSQYSGQPLHSGSRSGNGRPPRSNRSGSGRPQSPELGAYVRRAPREQQTYDAF